MTIECTGRVPDIPIETPADIVVGLGARAAASASEIIALIDLCLAEIDASRRAVVLCATHRDRLDHPGLLEAAAILGVPLVEAPADAWAHPVPNSSAVVVRHKGVPSIAEAAAQGFGPLLVQKRRSANATCALSRRLSYSPSTSIAAATLATSGAAS